MTINEIQDQIIKEFSVFDNWEDKYNHLISIAHTLEPMDQKRKSQNNTIRGCQNKIWLDVDFINGKLYFYCDSNACISKGIISLIYRVFNGQTPKDIVESDLYVIDKIGLKENWAPSRTNGILSMIKQIKLRALKYQ